MRPEAPKLLVWDNAPPHHPKRVAATAGAAHITIIWLPFRSPELMPCEDLWRLAKAQDAANRPYIVRIGRINRQTIWCKGSPSRPSSASRLSPFDRLRCPGLLGSKFQWFTTCCRRARERRAGPVTSTTRSATTLATTAINT